MHRNAGKHTNHVAWIAVMMILISLAANLFTSHTSDIVAAVERVTEVSGADQPAPNQTTQGQPVRPEMTDDRSNNQVRFLLMILIGICIVIGYAVLMFSLYKRYASDATKRGKHSQSKAVSAGKSSKSQVCMS